MFEPIQDSATVAVKDMIHCASDIRCWMTRNKLKLNDGKTEYMVISKHGLPEEVRLPDLKIGNCVIEPSDSLRNLGSFWDSQMTMNSHVTNVCKTCYMQLRNINAVKRYMDKETLNTLIHAFVTSRIDYGNGLLYGIPETMLSKVQLRSKNCHKR